MPVDDDLRARLSFGFDAATGALRFGVSGFFDGIGEDGFKADGVSANISYSF